VCVHCRSLSGSTREHLAELLMQAESATAEVKAALLTQVKDKALRALEGRLLRPLQVGPQGQGCQQPVSTL